MAATKMRRTIPPVQRLRRLALEPQAKPGRRSSSRNNLPRAPFVRGVASNRYFGAVQAGIAGPKRRLKKKIKRIGTDRGASGSGSG